MNNRTGLRINANKVEAEIGDAFKSFAKWLRKKHDYPIRVPVYLSNKKTIIGKDGESYVSIFFAPFDNKVEPFIRIATGDYQDMLKKLGKADALLNLLYSLSLGVVKYKKWLNHNLELESYEPDNDATELLQEYINYQKFGRGSKIAVLG